MFVIPDLLYALVLSVQYVFSTVGADALIGPQRLHRIRVDQGIDPYGARRRIFFFPY